MGSELPSLQNTLYTLYSMKMLPSAPLHFHECPFHRKCETAWGKFLQPLRSVLLSQMVFSSFYLSPFRILISSISFAIAVLNSLTKFFCPEYMHVFMLP